MKVSTENDNNFGYEKITILVDNIPLKRGVNVWILQLLLFFVGFYVNRDEDFARELFSVKFILHSSWYIRLSSTFLWTFFSMWSSVFVLCFFLNPMLSILHEWLDTYIHRSIVDKIDPTSEDVKRITNTLSITLGYTYFCEMWSDEFIYRVFNWSVKILLMNRDEDLPFFKLEECLMITFVVQNCLLDLFVVLTLDLVTDLNWNFFFVS